MLASDHRAGVGRWLRTGFVMSNPTGGTSRFPQPQYKRTHGQQQDQFHATRPSITSITKREPT